MSKPRLLIPFGMQFSVRYILRTGLLEQIGHVAQPVVLLDWADPELETELKAAGAEVHHLLEARLGREYQRVRSWINILHLNGLNTPSAPIWERRADLHRTLAQRLRRRARKKVFDALLSLPGTAGWLHRREDELFRSDTNAAEAGKHLDSLHVDAAFSLTPFLANEQMLLRICAIRGIPMCASILSFDNITTRGWIPVPFQRYLLWNRHNAAELCRSYPQIPDSAITIVGAPQFDFYWKPEYCWDEDTWRRELSLPANRPVILFGGGYYFCAPHEPHFLRQMDEAIERHEIRKDAVILFRNHPVDPIERWLPVLKRARHVVFDDPWPNGRITGRNNLRQRDIQKLASCLYHARAHVNVASTMAVDGAIFDRPQIGPAYDDTPGSRFDRTAQELYLQEHYLPITNSGGLEIVRGRQQLIEAVRSALEDPARLSPGRKRLVKEVCTFDDGRATGRVYESVRAFLQRPVPEEQAETEAAAVS